MDSLNRLTSPTFFLKKEPKTLALRGLNLLIGVVLFKKRTKNSSSARLKLVDRFKKNQKQ
jgi:hypothetical protein